jgi:manganese/zinc/iron transport system permease protein
LDNFYIILVISLIAVSCSLLGPFLLLRESTMLGDAISHAVLPGIALSFLLTKSMSLMNFIIGGTLISILTAVSIAVLENYFRLQTDIAIGTVFTTFFAVGVILISFFTSKVDLDQDCIIQGDPIYIPLDILIIRNIVIGPKALYTSMALLILNFLYVYTFYKELVISTFDINFARSIGIRTQLIHYTLFIITAINAMISFEAIGSIMVIALMVLPSSTAHLLTNNLLKTIILAIVISFITTIIGSYLSLRINTAVSASIVLIQGAFFTIVFLLKYIKRKTA